MSPDVQQTRDRLNAALLALYKVWGRAGLFEAVSAVCEGLAAGKCVLAELQQRERPPSDPMVRASVTGIRVLVAWADEAFMKIEDFARREIGRRLRDEGKELPPHDPGVESDSYRKPG